MIAWSRAHIGDLLRAALAVAGLTLVALLTHPRPAPPIDTFSVSDVRKWGYAAWEELMQREGVAVERFDRRPAELDGTIDTLIDAYGDEPIPADIRLEADTRALAKWVRAGGRLILIGRIPSLAKQEAALLKRPPQYAAKSGGDPMDASAFGGAVVDYTYYSTERFKPRAGRTLLADRGGAIILRVPLGHGAVIYVSDGEMFANEGLAQDDNARLAYLLARPRRPGRIIAFDEALHGAFVDRTWADTLSVPVRIALGGVVLTAILALIGGALRLGPPISLRIAREPASDEFIAAVAALYRRARARRAAIELLTKGTSHDGPSAPTDADLIASARTAHALRGEQA